MAGAVTSKSPHFAHFELEFDRHLTEHLEALCARASLLFESSRGTAIIAWRRPAGRCRADDAGDNLLAAIGLGKESKVIIDQPD